MDKNIKDIFKGLWGFSEWILKKFKKNVEIYCLNEKIILFKLFEHELIIDDKLEGNFYVDKIIQKYGRIKAKEENLYMISFKFNDKEWNLIRPLFDLRNTIDGETIIYDITHNDKINAWVKYNTETSSYYGISKTQNRIFFIKTILAAKIGNLFRPTKKKEMIQSSPKIKKIESKSKDKKHIDI